MRAESSKTDLRLIGVRALAMMCALLLAQCGEAEKPERAEDVILTITVDGKPAVPQGALLALTRMKGDRIARIIAAVGIPIDGRVATPGAWLRRQSNSESGVGLVVYPPNSSAAYADGMIRRWNGEPASLHCRSEWDVSGTVLPQSGLRASRYWLERQLNDRAYGDPVEVDAEGDFRTKVKVGDRSILRLAYGDRDKFAAPGILVRGNTDSINVAGFYRGQDPQAAPPREIIYIRDQSLRSVPGTLIFRPSGSEGLRWGYEVDVYVPLVWPQLTPHSDETGAKWVALLTDSLVNVPMAQTTFDFADQEVREWKPTQPSVIKSKLQRGAPRELGFDGDLVVRVWAHDSNLGRALDGVDFLKDKLGIAVDKGEGGIDVVFSWYPKETTGAPLGAHAVANVPAGSDLLRLGARLRPRPQLTLEVR